MLTQEMLREKYPNGPSIFDMMTDSNFSALLPKGHLPIISDPLPGTVGRFIQVRQRIMTDDGLMKFAYHAYLRKNGVLANYPQYDYAQMPDQPVGFIARFTVPIESPAPFNMEMAYFIALDSVNYEVVGDVRADSETRQILSTERINFTILDPLNYPNVHFDPRILEYQNHREELFEFFGIQ